MINKLKAVITVGCSGSGKSTWANAQCKSTDWVKIERDVIREHLLATTLRLNTYSLDDNLWKHWKFKNEYQVDGVVNSSIENASLNGKNIIIADTNLNVDRRKTLKSKLELLGYDVEIKVFGEDLNLDTLWVRDTYRKNTVGHRVIARQYEQFRREFPVHSVTLPTETRSAVIFDIDGTLAIMGDRSPFEWDRVGIDGYNHVLMHTLSALWYNNYEIIIMSGRDAICREETINWLTEWFDTYCDYKPEYKLFMRKNDDMRKDTIVKMELFKEHVDGKYTVKAVFDDRPSVIRDVWLELGLKVNCVGNQNIEF